MVRPPESQTSIHALQTSEPLEQLHMKLAAMDRFSGLAHSISTYLRRNLHVTASGMFLPHERRRAGSVDDFGFAATAAIIH